MIVMFLKTLLKSVLCSNDILEVLVTSFSRKVLLKSCNHLIIICHAFNKYTYFDVMTKMLKHM